MTEVVLVTGGTGKLLILSLFLFKNITFKLKELIVVVFI